MKKIISTVLCAAMAAVAMSGCSQNNGRDEKTVSFTAQSYTADASEVSELCLDVIDRQVSVLKSEDGKIHIDYFDSDNEFYEISTENGILTMNSASDKKWSDYIGTKPPAENRKISLSLPENTMRSLKIHTTNENISLAKMDFSEDVALSSNGGNVSFENLSAGNSITLDCKNGDIQGSIAGHYEDYKISCKIKKGDSNLPAEKESGQKLLNVAQNNGDIDIEFIV